MLFARKIDYHTFIVLDHHTFWFRDKVIPAGSAFLYFPARSSSFLRR